MPLFSFEGKSPSVHPDAWIAPTATLIGDVIVEADASVWYGAVIRADFGAVIIRAGANVQDNSVIHVGEGSARSAPARRSGTCAWCTTARSARGPWSATARPCSTAR